MASKDFALICGGDGASEDSGSVGRSILNTNHEKHAKTEKSVKIIEPTKYVTEKRIREKRQKVDKLIISQIENRIDDFDELKESCLPSASDKLMGYLLKFLLLFLFISMVKASICHSQNCYCETYWYESLLAGIFGVFATTYKEEYPR